MNDKQIDLALQYINERLSKLEEIHEVDLDLHEKAKKQLLEERLDQRINGCVYPNPSERSTAVANEAKAWFRELIMGTLFKDGEVYFVDRDELLKKLEEKTND